MLLDFAMGEFARHFGQRSKHTLLVRAHETRIAHYIGNEDRGQGDGWLSSLRQSRLAQRAAEHGNPLRTRELGRQ
jgi:hypothetical protein